MKYSAIKSQRIAGRSGMTLIESAIVFGVIGLVGGAIWATASAVRSRQPISDTVQIVTEIATNVRGIYSGHPTALPPAGITGQIAGGFYPDVVLNDAKSDTVNAWGDKVIVNFPAAPLNGFSVQFDLPAAVSQVVRREICQGMVSRLQGTAARVIPYPTVGTLPNGAPPPVEMNQGTGPSLVFINSGGWTNVTGTPTSQLFGASGAGDCTGFAFYYRL